MKKKLLVVVILSFIISLFSEGILWYLTPAKAVGVQLPEDAELMYPAMEYYTSGYDFVGSSYIPNNEDPQFGFILPGKEIENIIIYFENPLEEDTPINTYYAVNQEALSEAKIAKQSFEKGNDVAVIQLPHDVYTHIRMDIERPFSLKAIYACRSEAIIVSQKELPDIMRFIVIWGSLTIIFCAYLKIYELDLKKLLFEKLIQFSESVPKFKHFLIFCRKYKIFLIVIVLLLMVFLQINNSNLSCYDMVFPNNVAASGMVSLGNHRYIRSDEYLVTSPSFFNGALNEELSFWDSNASLIGTVYNIIAFLNPYYWGEIFLPAGYAFSWKFVFVVLFAIVVFYRFFYIITQNHLFSIIAGLLIIYSPGVQWWSGPTHYALYCAMIVFFHDFFATKQKYKKIIYAWGLVCCTSVLVFNIYPAWDIPLIYLFLFVLIGIYATERKIVFEKTDLPYVVVTSALMLVIVAAYFGDQAETTDVILNTVYPGKRFSAGGTMDLTSSYWGHYLVSPFITWKQPYSLLTNQSEISSHLHLFPLPFLVYFLKYKDFKHNKVMTSIVLFNIFSMVYILFGVGDFVAKYSLLSYSTTERMTTIWGFSLFLLMLLECYYIVPVILEKFSGFEIAKCAMINIMMGVFLTWFFSLHQDFVEYIGLSWIPAVLIGAFLLTILLFTGRKKLFLSAMCFLTIISGVIVNPINLGTGALTDTPLAKEIRQLDSVDPGNWIALDSLQAPKYVYAQGVDCLNYLSWPPRFDLFEPLDKTREFYDIYNRYAHVSIHLNTDNLNQNASFVLQQQDYFLLNMNINDLVKWDVKYILTQTALPETANGINFQTRYYDSLDNVYIYKVVY